MDLNIAWFLLVGVLIIGYSILDGFDLGVGALYPFLGKTEDDKKILLNSIGPFWDGNEVWLLTGGGALFAAFPLVYASVFSGFYLAMMLVLFALIFRAVALEFRNKHDEPKWHRLWDRAFFIGSTLPALLFGVAVGNIVKGLPLDANHNYTGGFFGLLNPYALLLGLVGLSAFLVQGNTFTLMKTEGALQKRVQQLLPKLWLAYVILYLLATIYSYFTAPHLFTNFAKYPVLYAIPLLTILGIVGVPLAAKTSRNGLAFASSSLAMAGQTLILAAGIFPNWVPAINPAYSLSIYNASSSPLTLKAMLIIALTGVPMVLFYTGYVYWVFRGKVRLSEAKY